MSSLSTLNDDAYYRRCFDIFHKRLQQQETLTEWLYGNVFDDIQSKVRSSIQCSTKTILRACGVGSGAGKTEDFFVSHFKPQFEQVYQRLVEPNKLQVQQHRNNASKMIMPGVTYDWREQTLEDYIEGVTGAGKEEKFHFISSIHSVYHFSNPTKLLGFLLDQLEENGVLLLIIASESSITTRLHGSHTIPHQYNRHYCTIPLVLDYFDSRGIPYDLYTRQQSLDVSGCLDDNDNMPEESSLLLDFLTHVKDFRKAPLPRDIKEKVFSIIHDGTISSEKEEVDNSADVLVVQRKK